MNNVRSPFPLGSTRARFKHAVRLRATICGLLVAGFGGCASVQTVRTTREAAALRAGIPDGRAVVWHYQGTDEHYHYFFASATASAVWSRGSPLLGPIQRYRLPKDALAPDEVHPYAADWPPVAYYYSVDVAHGFRRMDEKSEWPPGTLPPMLPVSIPPARRRVSARQLTNPVGADIPPVALTVSTDVSRVERSHPEIRSWAEQAAEVCRQWYPVICHATVPAGIDPPHRVRLVFVPHSIVPAFCDRSPAEIIFDVPNILRDPSNYGMVVHELTHLPQRNRNPDLSWLAEGIADYVRFYLYEVDPTHGALLPGVSKYTDSYRTTACFLDYLVGNYDPGIVLKFSAALRRPFVGLDTIRSIVADDPAVGPAKRKTLESLFAEFMASRSGRAPAKD